MIFTGSSHLKLAKEIASHLSMELGQLEWKRFPDSEINVRVLEEVRGKEVFLFQSLGKDPNNFLMELCILSDAMKRSSAGNVTAVIPYLGYTRQDRSYNRGEPITAKLVVNLLQASGIDRLITMDLHSEQIEGFFDIPLCHLSAREIFVGEIMKLNLPKPIVLAPDVGGAKHAARFASSVSCEMAIVHKKRGEEAGDLMGDVQGRDVVIVDDVFSTGETIKQSARLCRKSGAKSVYACITHGPLTSGPFSLDLDGFFVTDSVAQEKGSWKVLSSSLLFANAINQYQSNIM